MSSVNFMKGRVYGKDTIFKNLVGGPFYQYITSSDLLPKNVKLQLFDFPLDPDFLEGYKKNKLVFLTNIVLTDCEQYVDNIHTVDPAFYGMLHWAPEVDAFTTIERSFNCFMNRFDPFRQSWLYHLVRRDWLNRGYVSFNIDANDKKSTPLETFEQCFQTHNLCFHQEHVKIKDQVPYRNFDETGLVSDYILKSKFSIILETLFHSNQGISFTEKTMRCLQLPRPWILFSSQHAVKHLRQWGFDVLDDIVDHGYDNIANAVERQMAILDLAEKLMNLDMSAIIDRCIAACDHNRSMLQSWNQNWFINMDKEFEIARQKALAL
jgi:hypothetical protein